MGVLIIFAIIVHLIRPYNYNRFNLWQLIALYANVWVALLTSIAIFAEVSVLTLQFLLLIGLVVLVCFGMILQHLKRYGIYPSILFVPKRVNFYAKIRFMCFKPSDDILTIFSTGTKSRVKASGYSVDVLLHEPSSPSQRTERYLNSVK